MYAIQMQRASTNGSDGGRSIRAHVGLTQPERAEQGKTPASVTTRSCEVCD